MGVMAEVEQFKYWLDIAAREIAERYPRGEIIVSSGISPSADYHIGHYREIMTAEALTWGVRKLGRQARHLHVVDNFDPLRQWYDFLPPVEVNYAGWPIVLVPDPYGDCHPSYAEHFFAQFETFFAPMGMTPEVIKSYEDLYRPGHMAKYIEQVLEHTEEIKAALKRVSNRDLPDDWTPVLALVDHKFVKAELSSWDRTARTIGGVDYTKGEAKLDWRLDWPARWAYLGVQVEPFGAQEHGAAGGSYYTGREFARLVFGIEPPYGEIQYGHIHRPGEAVKMSSSKGNGVTPKEALEIMPAEVLRYFIVRSRPEKKLYFDPGLGLYNLIDEFAAAGRDDAHEFRDAYNFAVDGQVAQIISSVPFSHLVSVYQAALGKVAQVMEILERTGYGEAVAAEGTVIKRELEFVQNWLAKYAPDSVKFTVQDELPKVELTRDQVEFLQQLAVKIAAEADLTGQGMHDLIYAVTEETGINKAAAFKAIYWVILGKDAGPKAGWFLASLERDWLVERLSGY